MPFLKMAHMHNMYFLDSIYNSEWALWLSKEHRVNAASLANYHCCPCLPYLSSTISFLAPRIHFNLIPVLGWACLDGIHVQQIPLAVQ